MFKKVFNDSEDVYFFFTLAEMGFHTCLNGIKLLQQLQHLLERQKLQKLRILLQHMN